MTAHEPMNKYFNLADWVVVFAYLCDIDALRLWFGKDQRNTRDDFLGNRSIGCIGPSVGPEASLRFAN
jgi:hypothetical protein